LVTLESTMLHITDGESVAGTLRESGIPGRVAVYGDLMYEGPIPAGIEATLGAYSQHDEVVIWLDNKLSNQLMLIRMLDWFSRRDLGAVKLSLICIGQYPGQDHFRGLGALTADQLASLADTRRPVGEVQYRTAQAAWNAFASPDPTEIERFMATDGSALPFLAAAMRRHLEQFPSVENGLSRTERQALSVLCDRGPLSGGQLFVAVQLQEEQVYMGDTSFYKMMAELHEARHPLVHVSDPGQHSLGAVTITEAGRNVAECRTDHIRLNGIDRWLGGVHLTNDGAAWRWDRAAGRLVDQSDKER
jgi:hypothetical protein